MGLFIPVIICLMVSGRRVYGTGEKPAITSLPLSERDQERIKRTLCDGLFPIVITHTEREVRLVLVDSILEFSSMIVATHLLWFDALVHHRKGAKNRKTVTLPQLCPSRAYPKSPIYLPLGTTS